MGNRPDPFAFTKAIHKAQRNAIKQLLPIAIIKDVLNFYLKGEQPKQASVQETNPKEGNTKRMSYAVAKTLYDPLAKQGITKEILWDYIKNKYNIASSNDMKEQQWAELSAILKGAQTEQQLFDNFVDDIKAYLALLMENTKKKVTQVWDSIESDIKPLTKKDCFEAAQNVYGPSSAWNYEMWDQFGDDLVDWKEEGTYINDLYKKYTYIDDLYKKCKSTTTPDQPENLPTEQTGDSIDISYEEENEGQSEQEILDELN